MYLCVPFNNMTISDQKLYFWLSAVQIQDSQIQIQDSQIQDSQIQDSQIQDSQIVFTI